MNTTLEFHQQGRTAAFLDDVGEGAIADLLREGGAVLRPGVEVARKPISRPRRSMPPPAHSHSPRFAATPPLPRGVSRHHAERSHPALRVDALEGRSTTEPWRQLTFGNSAAIEPPCRQ